MIKKILLYILLIFILILPQKANASIVVKNYITWWPTVTTPWVFKNQIGGMWFLNYERSTEYPRLQSDFNQMIETHKPDLLVIMSDWKDWQPLYFKNGNYRLPEGTNTVADVLYPDLNYQYFDDVMTLAKINSIPVLFYLNTSAYGGQVSYPFSYYSKSSWFWKRPDWQGPGQGIADPTTEAMRYPPSELNGASYNWIEHEAGYVNANVDEIMHWDLIANLTEDTGIGVPREWNVFEAPNMVFNGFDTVLQNNTFHLHSPIPSLSSQVYRDTTRELYKKIALHYKGQNIFGYSIFQEPTYAHLRENINICDFNAGALGGDTCLYEVDYSQAELSRYNLSRKSRGLTLVSQIPYPVNTDYEQFRKDNLADFMLNLKQGIKEGDPNANVMLSLFSDDTFKGMGTDIMASKIINPELLTMEPPHISKKYFEDSFLRDKTINQLITNYTSRRYFSYYISSMEGKTYQQSDFTLANAFTEKGFTEYWAPAVSDGTQDSAYATWRGNSCTGCTFRYKNPGIPVGIQQSSDINTNSMVDIMDIKYLLTHWKEKPEYNLGMVMAILKYWKE